MSGRPAASASATAGTTSSPSSTQIASISGASSGPGNAAAAWPPTRMKASGRRAGSRGPSRSRGRTRGRACRRCRPGAGASAAPRNARGARTADPRSPANGRARGAPRPRTRGPGARRGRKARARTVRCRGPGGSGGRSWHEPRIVNSSTHGRNHADRPAGAAAEGLPRGDFRRARNPPAPSDRCRSRKPIRVHSGAAGHRAEARGRQGRNLCRGRRPSRRNSPGRHSSSAASFRGFSRRAREKAISPSSGRRWALHPRSGWREAECARSMPSSRASWPRAPWPGASGNFDFRFAFGGSLRAGAAAPRRASFWPERASMWRGGRDSNRDFTSSPTSSRRSPSRGSP